MNNHKVSDMFLTWLDSQKDHAENRENLGDKHFFWSLPFDVTV